MFLLKEQNTGPHKCHWQIADALTGGEIITGIESQRETEWASKPKMYLSLPIDNIFQRLYMDPFIS